MADPATKPDDALDDTTLVVAAADLDSTMVVEAPNPAAEHDTTHVEFLRKVQARARARAQQPAEAPAPVKAAEPAPDRRKKAFFSPVVTRLVNRGVLSQSDAISASLRARDQGITFLGAIAQISALAGSEEFYRALAEEAGLRFIANDRDLLAEVTEVAWLSAKEAEQRGVLVLRRQDGG